MGVHCSLGNQGAGAGLKCQAGELGPGGVGQPLFTLTPPVTHPLCGIFGLWASTCFSSLPFL